MLRKLFNEEFEITVFEKVLADVLVILDKLMINSTTNYYGTKEFFCGDLKLGEMKEYKVTLNCTDDDYQKFKNLTYETKLSEGIAYA